MSEEKSEDKISKSEELEAAGLYEHFPEDKGAPPQLPGSPGKGGIAVTTLNFKPQTSEMEVHHHGHVHHQKKWKEYLFQFFMLFLAVFCGFLAEYALEHKIEKDRERQYIRSFVEDLNADTVSLNSRIEYCNKTIKRADSAIAVFNDPELSSKGSEIYYFLRWIHRSDFFSVNDRTIIQLRNAGGMRLVSNKIVSDSMVSYYKEVEFIRFIYEEQIEWRRSLRPHFPAIFDGNDYGKTIDEKNNVIRSAAPLKLKTENKEAINALILDLNNVIGINRTLRIRMENLKAKAKTIRKMIVAEYHLR